MRLKRMSVQNKKQKRTGIVAGIISLVGTAPAIPLVGGFEQGYCKSVSRESKCFMITQKQPEQNG